MVSFAVLLAGFCGGMIRGLVNFIKYQFSYKKVPFHFGYFLSMILVSGTIGITASWVVGSLVDYEAVKDIMLVYAFIAGYAGGDFIENAFKVVFKKPDLFILPQLLKKS